MMSVPESGKVLALSTEMLVSAGPTAETSLTLVLGEPVRVAEGVGVTVIAPDCVGVGVVAVPERVGETVRVRVGVAVPRVGVFVGGDVTGPRQIPTLHGWCAGEQQSESSTHESLWKSEVHVTPAAQSVSSRQSVSGFSPPQVPEQNFPVEPHCEVPHCESRRHANPLKSTPPPRQTFADPVHGRPPAQLNVTSQQAPASIPAAHVPFEGVSLQTGWAEQLPLKHSQA